MSLKSEGANGKESAAGMQTRRENTQDMCLSNVH